MLKNFNKFQKKVSDDSFEINSALGHKAKLSSMYGSNMRTKGNVYSPSTANFQPSHQNLIPLKPGTFKR